MAAVAPAAEVLIGRIAIGAILGGIIGYERDRHGRPVGLRTHTIVAMAAATFMVLSAWFAYYQGYEVGGIVDVDGSRIAASVVSGIGFLAGGAILRTGLSVQGLTTAAGLWLVTAIGMCAGAGMFMVATAVTLMGMLALTVLRRFEDKADDITRHRVTLTVAAPPTAIIADLQRLGATVRELAYEHERANDEPLRRLELDLALPDRVSLTLIVNALEAHPDIRRFRVEPR